ncbi:hypothetical protein JOD25_003112 [Kurthia huakuii]|uniref:PilZ domain-containing protein n=2 Tax=Kurthia huakuii TaxID=1421019 RepID=UPI0009DD1758|nr:PilZ domain-containing protein [Kurthia huakuii]MBM7700758.1 hypothetical protein [Kurthia huakuii]
MMEFKRNESFRHTLICPIDVVCTMKQPADGVALEIHGKMIDISPNGMRLGFEHILPQGMKDSALTLQFMIHERTLETEGECVWVHPNNTCGISLQVDGRMQETIIEDLKLRRKQEVANSKKK